MSDDNRTAETLQAIADALDTDVRTILALREVMTQDIERLAPRHGEMAMLLALIRLWRTLPDAESRLQVLRYAEALAATPVRAD